MPDLDRDVAGIRCRDVLALLADYVDGELEPATVDQVNAHLRGCDHCEKFGGEYQALVVTLRKGLSTAESSEHVMERLEQKMDEVWSDTP